MQSNTHVHNSNYLLKLAIWKSPQQQPPFGALKECNRGDPLSAFCFPLILKPILDMIELTVTEVHPRVQVLAILDNIAINIGATYSAAAFETATDCLRQINICTVPSKSHVLL